MNIFCLTLLELHSQRKLLFLVCYFNLILIFKIYILKFEEEKKHCNLSLFTSITVTIQKKCLINLLRNIASRISRKPHIGFLWVNTGNLIVVFKVAKFSPWTISLQRTISSLNYFNGIVNLSMNRGAVVYGLDSKVSYPQPMQLFCHPAARISSSGNEAQRQGRS